MMLIDIHEPGQSPTVQQGSASVGIDLGTTNSLVAVSNNGIREVVETESGEKMLSSIVAYTADGGVIVGDKALDESHFIRSVKRLMGRGLADVKTIAGALPFDVVDDTHGMVTLDINGRHVTPVEVSAEILKELKKRAETVLDNDVDRAVITVPAYFDDAARQATKDAAKLAGLEVMRLVNEPTAAALAYGLDNEAEGIYAVYDFGGGTFDVSLLKMEKGVFQVLATGGDAALGGDDFDHTIAEHFVEEFLTGLDLTQADVNALVTVARNAKEALTDATDGEWKVMIAGKEMQVALSRDEFNGLIAGLVERTIETIRRVLVDSHVKRDEIKGVVLVGGSTRVPLVRAKVEEFLGQPPLTDVDPDLVVAIGAAVQAESLSQGSNTLLLDVTPLSLGLETMGGLTEVLIPRNTPIPTSMSQKFTTFKDNQTGLKVHVVQGEREMVFQNRSLANFDLKGIPPMAAGSAVVEVIFTLDADGLLTVSAVEETTGVKQVVEVKPTYGLPDEKMEQMLRDSMVHAREDITTRLLAESRVEADVAINGVISAIDNDGDLLDDDYRLRIDKQLELVRALKKADDRDVLDYEVAQMDKLCTEFAEQRVNRAVGSFLEGQAVDQVDKKVS
jgi:molecular chaperone HscA